MPSALNNIEGCESIESDRSPLNMMETTREQVDIVALGSNSYLWLKNTAKICILICTPNARESDCRSRTEKSTYFGILHVLEPQKGAYLTMHKTAIEQLRLDFFTKQLSYDTKNNQ